VRYGTADQLARQGVRKEVDREGILRAIEIEDVDLQPCGGTHVKSTGQIGLVLIRRCMKVRHDWRVEFVCGRRAESNATLDFQVLREISDRLSCSPEEAPSAIEKALGEREVSFKNLRVALQQLAESRSKLMIATAIAASGIRCVSAVLREENFELLAPLATELAKNEKTIALLIHEPTGQLVFAQSPDSGKDLGAALKQVFISIPGKGGGTPDFVRARLSEPSQSGAALRLAAQFLAG
jgi:alanyl-tRNA synthetase